MRITTIKQTKAVLESDKKLLAVFLGEIRTNLLGVGSFFELINSTCIMVAASDSFAAAFGRSLFVFVFIYTNLNWENRFTETGFSRVTENMAILR